MTAPANNCNTLRFGVFCRTPWFSFHSSSSSRPLGEPLKWGVLGKRFSAVPESQRSRIAAIQTNTVTITFPSVSSISFHTEWLKVIAIGEQSLARLIFNELRSRMDRVVGGTPEASERNLAPVLPNLLHLKHRWCTLGVQRHPRRAEANRQQEKYLYEGFYWSIS